MKQHCNTNVSFRPYMAILSVMKIQVVKTIRILLGKFPRFPEQYHFRERDCRAVRIREYVKPYNLTIEYTPRGLKPGEVKIRAHNKHEG